MKLANEWVALYRTKTPNPIKNKEFMEKYKSIESRYMKLSKPLKAKFHKIIHAQIGTHHAADIN